MNEYKKIVEILLENCYDTIEFVINDSVLENIFEKLPNADPKLIQKAINSLTEHLISKKTKKDLNESQQTWNGGISGIKMEVPKAQLGDTVMFNKQKGYIVGSIGDDLLVQVQGSVHKTPSSGVKVLGAKAKTMKPPFKFDEKTQKLLYEQWVRCGIYQNTVPIKTNGCYVKYSDWQSAKNNDQINIIVEGQHNILFKSQIKIFEDVNQFANLDNYIEGVVIDEETGNVIENIHLNVEDYTESLGNADPVRIIRGANSPNPKTDTVPKAILRTTSV